MSAERCHERTAPVRTHEHGMRGCPHPNKDISAPRVLMLHGHLTWPGVTADSLEQKSGQNARVVVVVFRRRLWLT
eukprot:2702510-Prymnesium_polylepis.1